MGKALKAIVPQAGRPLYITARDAVREAIDEGVFTPGEQMPSTKELSEQLAVSLVTAHRALQELVNSGVLQRSQGKGTFVHQRYLDRKETISTTRVGLVFHNDASLADFYHAQVLEGIRQAAQSLAVDLLLLRFGLDIRNECNGYLYVDPLPEEIETMAAETNRRQPILAIGAKSRNKRINSIAVDNLDIAKQAVGHLASLGHQQIGYVGGADGASNSQDRWQGFQDACVEKKIAVKETNLIRTGSWKLEERDRLSLIRLLSSAARPTAIFAAGYYFTLDCYAAVATVGLRVPEDISIVGVDDPPSASHLSPPLTTLRQPLMQLGQAGITSLHELISRNSTETISRTLWPELVIRRSTAPVK